MKGEILCIRSFVLAVQILENVLGSIRSVWKVLIQFLEGFREI